MAQNLLTRRDLLSILTIKNESGGLRARDFAISRIHQRELSGPYTFLRAYYPNDPDSCG
jgi:hypothetical protein